MYRLSSKRLQFITNCRQTFLVSCACCSEQYFSTYPKIKINPLLFRFLAALGSVLLSPEIITSGSYWNHPSVPQKSYLNDTILPKVYQKNMPLASFALVFFTKVAQH